MTFVPCASGPTIILPFSLDLRVQVKLMKQFIRHWIDWLITLATWVEIGIGISLSLSFISCRFADNNDFFLLFWISAAMTGHFFWLACPIYPLFSAFFDRETNVWRASHNWIPIKPQITSKLHYLLSQYYIFFVSRLLIAKHFRYFSHVRVLSICHVNASIFGINGNFLPPACLNISAANAINFWFSFFSQTHIYIISQSEWGGGLNKPPKSFVWLAISMGVTETLRSRGNGKRKAH